MVQLHTEIKVKVQKFHWFCRRKKGDDLATGASHKQRTDLTTGSIGRKLLLFTLPLLGSSLIQQLYNTVDIFFVGNFVSDPNAMPAVGASSLIVSLLVGFFTGMSVGAGVVVSLFYGEHNEKKLSQAVHTAITIGLIGGVVLTVAGFFASPLILQWMNTPPEIFDMAVTYIRIYFLSLLSLLLYDMGVGILRAVGDSRRPLLYLVVGGVLNVILDFLFVALLQWGVTGVAVATLISQTVPAVLVIVHLLRVKQPYRIVLRKLRVHKEMFRRIFRVGVPAGVQSIVITLSNMVVQYHINGFGPDAIAAFTAYFKVELLLYLPIVSFGQAVTTFTGQNVGAGRYDRVRSGVRFSLVMGVLFTGCMSTAVTLLGRQIFGCFTHQAAVIDRGMEVLYITAPLYFLYVFLEVFSGAVRGSGSSAVPMILVIANMCLLRVALLTILVPLWNTIAAVAVCYPITWLTTSLCLGIYYFKGRLYQLIKSYRPAAHSQQTSLPSPNA